jgi:hypothetical protein
MSLISQAAYARLVGVSRQAISRQVQNGLIATHGPARRIDPEEAAQGCVPRIDAGAPQLDVRRAAADPSVATWVAWWRWCDATAGSLAQALSVPRQRVQAPLVIALRRQLMAIGLLAADDDLDDAGDQP